MDVRRRSKRRAPQRRHLKEGCLWNEETSENAALGGHLHVLKWLRKKGCPWDKRTCSEAARGGHLLQV